MHNYWQNFSGPPEAMFGAGLFAGLGLIGFIIFLAWSLVWRGMALWKAARRGDNKWFIVLLIVNTVGILDILYLYVFSKKEKAISGK